MQALVVRRAVHIHVYEYMCRWYILSTWERQVHMYESWFRWGNTTHYISYKGCQEPFLSLHRTHQRVDEHLRLLLTQYKHFDILCVCTPIVGSAKLQELFTTLIPWLMLQSCGIFCIMYAVFHVVMCACITLYVYVHDLCCKSHE